MSEQTIGDDLWAEMTDGQKLDALVNGRASLKQISAGLLDGSEALRNACHQFLAHTGPAFENVSSAAEAEGLNELAAALTEAARKQKASGTDETKPSKRAVPHLPKQRFGLPEGFVPRLQRYGRAVLLELISIVCRMGRSLFPPGQVARWPAGNTFTPS